MGRELGFGEDVELPLVGIAVAGGGVGAGCQAKMNRSALRLRPAIQVGPS